MSPWLCLENAGRRNAAAVAAAASWNEKSQWFEGAFLRTAILLPLTPPTLPCSANLKQQPLCRGEPGGVSRALLYLRHCRKLDRHQNTHAHTSRNTLVWWLEAPLQNKTPLPPLPLLANTHQNRLSSVPCVGGNRERGGGGHRVVYSLKNSRETSPCLHQRGQLLGQRYVIQLRRCQVNLPSRAQHRTPQRIMAQAKNEPRKRENRNQKKTNGVTHRGQTKNCCCGAQRTTDAHALFQNSTAQHTSSEITAQVASGKKENQRYHRPRSEQENKKTKKNVRCGAQRTRRCIP